MNRLNTGPPVRYLEVSSVMPTCGYVVLPDPGAVENVAAELDEIQGCQVFPAENRDLLLLVTQTGSFEDDLQLRQAVSEVAGVDALFLTFGEIDPDTPVADPVWESRS